MDISALKTRRPFSHAILKISEETEPIRKVA